MSTKATTYPDVRELGHATLDVTPQDRDWSEGYGETWEYITAPDCPTCGELCGYIETVDEMIDALGIHVPDDGDDRDVIEGRMGDELPAWRCVNLDCDQHCEEIDPHDAGAEGPMMNYAYPFPYSLDESNATKLGGLPLCIVNHSDDRTELALTGGGMDLSWEICEAFMRLGQLPPVHFCDLPAMAGRGRSERDRWIIAGCLLAVNTHASRAAYRAAYVADSLERMRNSE